MNRQDDSWQPRRGRLFYGVVWTLLVLGGVSILGMIIALFIGP